MFETVELGLAVGSMAPLLTVNDHERKAHRLDSLCGEHGLMLGFFRDIWLPASIRRILYLQKHSHKFARMGINVALMIADKQQAVYSFYMSSPMSFTVPLLVDTNLDVHSAFRIEHPSLMLLDKTLIVRDKWMMPHERVWPKVSELLESAEALSRPH